MTRVLEDDNTRRNAINPVLEERRGNVHNRHEDFLVPFAFCLPCRRFSSCCTLVYTKCVQPSPFHNNNKNCVSSHRLIICICSDCRLPSSALLWWWRHISWQKPSGNVLLATIYIPTESVAVNEIEHRKENVVFWRMRFVCDLEGSIATTAFCHRITNPR